MLKFKYLFFAYNKNSENFEFYHFIKILIIETFFFYNIFFKKCLHENYIFNINIEYFCIF